MFLQLSSGLTDLKNFLVHGSRRFGSRVILAAGCHCAAGVGSSCTSPLENSARGYGCNCPQSFLN